MTLEEAIAEIDKLKQENQMLLAMSDHVVDTKRQIREKRFNTIRHRGHRFGFTLKAPFGWIVNNGQIEINPHEQDAINRMVDLRMSGVGAASIAGIFNGETGNLCRGRPWRSNYVWKVLERTGVERAIRFPKSNRVGVSASVMCEIRRLRHDAGHVQKVKELRVLASEMRRAGVPLREIASTLGIPKSSAGRYARSQP